MQNFSKGDQVRYSGPKSDRLSIGKTYTVLRMGGYCGTNVIIEGLYENGEAPDSGIEQWKFKLVRKAADPAKLLAQATSVPVRKTDPETSIKAAKQPRIGLRTRIHELMRNSAQGFTGQELADKLDVRLNSVTPRFAELRRAHIVKDSGVRRDGQIVWVLK